MQCAGQPGRLFVSSEETTDCARKFANRRIYGCVSICPYSRPRFVDHQTLQLFSQSVWMQL